jgi:hypothetical protein
MAKQTRQRATKSRPRTTVVQLHRPTIRKIVSGGQTGVDRAALDAAMELGLPHGGWCPRGRLAEDGKIPRRYQLQEADSRSYYVRTQKNVQDSDGTLILYRRMMTGGTALTKRFAEQMRKPLFYVDLAKSNEELALRNVWLWLRLHRIETLNIAGPRRSTAPGIQVAAKAFLLTVFQQCEVPLQEVKTVSRA